MGKSIVCMVWFVVFQAVSYALGILHREDVHSWYIFLHKSSLTPPGYLFGIVWPILYTLLALAGCMLWQEKDYKRAKMTFMLQMLLNWSWTTLFFKWHCLLVSWILIAFMIVGTIIVILDTYKRLRLVSWLLAPYLAWICFAFYLNVFIWLYN